MNNEKLGFLPGWSVQRVAGVVNRHPFSGKRYDGAELQKNTIRTLPKFLSSYN
jgi:hypothetical protein